MQSKYILKYESQILLQSSDVRVTGIPDLTRPDSGLCRVRAWFFMARGPGWSRVQIFHFRDGFESKNWGRGEGNISEISQRLQLYQFSILKLNYIIGTKLINENKHTNTEFFVFDIICLFRFLFVRGYFFSFNNASLITSNSFTWSESILDLLSVSVCLAEL